MPNLIEIVVSGKNEAKGALAEAKRDSEGLAGTMNKMGLASTAILAGIGIEATKMATSYESSTTRLVTSAGESTKGLAVVSKGMKDMAGSVGTTAQDLSKGMYTVESAGFHAADGLTVLKAAAQGAKDENADLGTVANAVTDVLVDYHLKASDAADVTSKMVTAVSFGKTTFDDFSGSMHNILPLASAMHLQFADVSGVLAEMTAHGMSADQASQNMANAMRSLIAPTAKQEQEFKALGISAQDVRDKLSTAGLAGTMQFLAETAKKVGPNVLDQEAALKKLMGTAPGLSVALMTTGENFKSTTDAIKGISGASADAQGNVKGFSEVQQTLAFKVDAAKASFDSLMITLGNKFIPVLKDAMDWGNKNSDMLIRVGEAVATLAGALTAYSLITKVATAITAAFDVVMALMDAEMDANPVMLIVLALIALGVALYELLSHWKTVWGEVKKVVNDVWKFLTKTWDEVKKDAERIWGDIEKDASRIWGDIVGKVKQIWGDLSKEWDKTGGKVVTAIANTWTKVSGAISKEWDHIYADLSSIWGNLVELWNDTGGKVVTLAKEQWEFVYNGIIKPTWDEITGLFGTALGYIGNVTKTGWDAISGAVKTAWDGVYGIIRTVWDLIYGAISGAISVIGGFLKGAWDGIYGAAKASWDLIKGAINTPLDLIKDLFQLFTDFVTGHWSKLWNDVKKTASDLWNNIYGTISGTLGDIGKAVVTGAKSIWDGFKNGTAEALKSIGKAVGDVKNTVVNVFNDAIHWLEQVGKDIVQGLINGISSMASNVGGALGNIASNIGNALNPSNWFAHGGEVGHAATGGVRSGLVMVGEHGPELVRLPTGSTVRSNPDTMAALAGAGGGGGQVQLEWIGPVGDQFFEMFKQWIRIRGGTGPNSVQHALGQSW